MTLEFDDMSEETATATAEEEHAAETPAAPAEPFTRQDLEQFAADDAEAGRTIGQMLSILFVYTVIAMSIVSLWTIARSIH